MNVTKLEQDVIDYCLAVEIEDMGAWATISELAKALNLTEKQIGGVVTSLQNKKLAWVEETNNGQESSVLWLNELACK